MAKKKKAKKAKPKLGRPTKYCKDKDEEARNLCLLGLVDEKIAKFFKVGMATISRWKIAHPSFRAAIKSGREPADGKVAASLYERACGYSHPEDKIFCTDGQVTVVPTIKHYPPDTAAAFIWLKNRAHWTDRREVGVSDETPQPATVEELREALAEAEAMLKEAHVIQLQVNHEVA